jgi:hypothetical protein
LIAAGGLLALALLGAHAAPRPFQTAPTAQESELDKLLRVAKTGKAPVRPQAARRIVRLWNGAGEPERGSIIERLLTEAGPTNATLAKLGSALVEVMGEFEDTRLRARLWTAVDDPDFPWRPYAARGLAAGALDLEHGRFVALLTDPIGPVRAATIGALEALDARAQAPAVRALLADEVGAVRRAAADLLVRWGHDDALWFLFEELGRDDRFFDRPTGREARYKAERQLKTHLGDLGEYDAGHGPVRNAGALAALATAIEARAGARPELPPVARASAQPIAGEAIGLELRSCRRGEFFLRWTRDDRLLVGQGTPAIVELAPGTTARLLVVGAAQTAKVERRSFGSPGCDIELLHWRPADNTTVWLVSKGPAAVSDLRPAALGEFYRELVSSLPRGASADPRLDHLRERALAALASIGGPLE